MAVLWTAVALVLCAANLHFFWTAQHITAPSTIQTVDNTSPRSGFRIDDGRISSKPEATTIVFNHSVLQSTSDAVRPLATMSQQLAASSSSFGLPVPDKVGVVGTSEFDLLVTANPSTDPVLASASATAERVQYCLIARRYIRFYLDVWYWIDLTLWSIAPFITIIHAFSV